ncbi:MAG: hypothetical protein HRF50_08245 [Phycisphaerae bacterium]|jgi:hypothetical protein
MAVSKSALRFAGVSSAAVEKATGKGWEAWFRILDRAGATDMSHKQIAAYLNSTQDVGDWWSQMVTVGYEQARGRREKHQRPDGYAVSGSKIIACPVSEAFRSWQDSRRRARWLPHERITIRTATPDKSMRITWSDGVSSLSANFYSKGDRKCQVAVQHGKLPDRRAAERMKAFWAERLDALRAQLED